MPNADPGLILPDGHSGFARSLPDHARSLSPMFIDQSRIVSGYSDGTFKGTRSITTGEAMESLGNLRNLAR